MDLFFSIACPQLFSLKQHGSNFRFQIFIMNQPMSTTNFDALPPVLILNCDFVAGRWPNACRSGIGFKIVVMPRRLKVQKHLKSIRLLQQAVSLLVQ
jgi:hypothetical protein